MINPNMPGQPMTRLNKQLQIETAQVTLHSPLIEKRCILLTNECQVYTNVTTCLINKELKFTKCWFS
jgi:hypothetical protein